MEQDAQQQPQQQPPVTSIPPEAAPVQPAQSGTAPAPADQQAAPQIPTSVVSADEQQQFSQELLSTGKLSDASYQLLANRGIDKALVDTYLRGVTAQAQDAMAPVREVLGSEEAFQPIKAWAATSLSEADKAAYNQVFASGNQVAIKAALSQLSSQYKAANPQPPAQVIEGVPQTAPVGDIFTSREAMASAMQDPKYWSDPVYAQGVAARIARSLKAGVKLG